MSESIKQHVAGAKMSQMGRKELKKLLDTALVDLTALRATVAVIVTDVANVRVSVNNLCNDIVKVNCNTASANNSVAITAAAPTVSSSAPSALTLVS